MPVTLCAPHPVRTRPLASVFPLTGSLVSTRAGTTGGGANIVDSGSDSSDSGVPDIASTQGTASNNNGGGNNGASSGGGSGENGAGGSGSPALPPPPPPLANISSKVRGCGWSMLLLDMHKVCPHVNSIAHYQQEYFTQCVHMVLQVNTTSPRVIAVTAACTLADVLCQTFKSLHMKVRYWLSLHRFAVLLMCMLPV